MHKFHKSQRLLQKVDYDHVFEKAKKLTVSGVILLYRDNSLDHARLGLALSKKMVAKAHDRNRLKRLLRESFRTSQLPPIDIVILARKGVGRTKNSVIFEQLSQAWAKLCVK